MIFPPVVLPSKKKNIVESSLDQLAEQGRFSLHNLDTDKQDMERLAYTVKHLEARVRKLEEKEE